MHPILLALHTAFEVAESPLGPHLVAVLDEKTSSVDLGNTCKCIWESVQDGHFTVENSVETVRCSAFDMRCPSYSSLIVVPSMTTRVTTYWNLARLFEERTPGSSMIYSHHWARLPIALSIRHHSFTCTPRSSTRRRPLHRLRPNTPVLDPIAVPNAANACRLEAFDASNTNSSDPSPRRTVLHQLFPTTAPCWTSSPSPASQAWLTRPIFPTYPRSLRKTRVFSRI